MSNSIPHNGFKTVSAAPFTGCGQRLLATICGKSQGYPQVIHNMWYKMPCSYVSSLFLQKYLYVHSGRLLFHSAINQPALQHLTGWTPQSHPFVGTGKLCLTPKKDATNAQIIEGSTRGKRGRHLFGESIVETLYRFRHPKACTTFGYEWFVHGLRVAMLTDCGIRFSNDVNTMVGTYYG